MIRNGIIIFFASVVFITTKTFGQLGETIIWQNEDTIIGTCTDLYGKTYKTTSINRSIHPIAQAGNYTDSRDGKTYKTSKIGTQTWMAENLAYKTDSGCWAYNNDPNNILKYGYLYTWAAAKTACPNGWHLPSDSEWTTLITFLGYDTLPKIKETTGLNKPHCELSSNFWNGLDSKAAGFSAIRSGTRLSSGAFTGISACWWWSSTSYNAASALARNLDSYHAYGRNTGEAVDIRNGLCIRCILDKKL